jgi:hypothetical protein
VVAVGFAVGAAAVLAAMRREAIGYVLRLAMRKIPLLALLAFSVLPTWPVSANVLTPTDAKALSEIELQALDIGLEMHSALKKTVPTNANANTFDCVFDLDTPLFKFIAALRPLKFANLSRCSND